VERQVIPKITGGCFLGFRFTLMCPINFVIGEENCLA
jgi:hypothetical protein